MLRLVELSNAAVSLETQIASGQTGATVQVGIRKASTTNSWLDFGDNTFKTSAWASRQTAMAEVSAALAPGLYRYSLDLTSLLPTLDGGDRLVAVYDIFNAAPAIQLYDQDEIAIDVTATQLSVDFNSDLIESQRRAHTWQDGERVWMSPNAGDTIANGASGSRTKPVNTITEALSLVSDSGHSVIFLVADAVGVTTHDEAVTINKRYTFFRGPGRDFVWKTSAVGDTITVEAEGIELSGFQVETHTVGNGAGVRVSGADFCEMRHLWFSDTRGSAVEISNSDHSIVEDCTLEGTGLAGSGHGIQITPAAGTSMHARIRNNHISGVAGDGIRLNGANVDDVVIERNSIHECTGWGINLIDTLRIMLLDNRLGLNDSGDINDGGTDTIDINNQQWSTSAALATHDTDILASISAHGGAIAALLATHDTAILAAISPKSTTVEVAAVLAAVGLLNNLDAAAVLAALTTDLVKITGQDVTDIADEAMGAKTVAEDGSGTVTHSRRGGAAFGTRTLRDKGGLAITIAVGSGAQLGELT